MNNLYLTDLEAEAKKRGLKVKGTGKNGRVLRVDLVNALEKTKKKSAPKRSQKKREPKKSPKTSPKKESKKVWRVMYDVGTEEPRILYFHDKEKAISSGVEAYRELLEQQQFAEGTELDEFLEGIENTLRTIGFEIYDTDIYIELEEVDYPVVH